MKNEPAVGRRSTHRRRATSALLAVVLAAACSHGTLGAGTAAPATGSTPVGGVVATTAPSGVATTAPAGTTTSTVAATSAGLLCGTTAVQRVGTVASDELAEISGVAAGRLVPDVVWVHNDSGADAIVYALDLTGATLARVEVRGVEAVDWEDIASGPGPDGSTPTLFVADIGDNAEARDRISIVRFPEPALSTRSVTADVITLQYPDRPHNAEAFAVEPRTGDWYVITKESRGSSTMFRAPRPGAGSSTVALEAVATIAVRPDLVTGADISPDGTALAIRTYLSVRTYAVEDGQVARSFGVAACIGPNVHEAQGEAVAFSADGRAIITISEGEHPAINVIRAG